MFDAALNRSMPTNPAVVQYHFHHRERFSVGAADRVVCLLLLAFVALSPLLDAAVGIQWSPEANNMLGKIMRAAWIVSGLIYVTCTRSPRSHRGMWKLITPFLVLALIEVAIELPINRVYDAAEAGGKVLFFVVSVAAATRLSARRAIRNGHLSMAIAIGGLILIGAVLAGGVGGLGVRNVYQSQRIVVANTIFSGQTTAAFALILYGVMGMRWRPVVRLAWAVAVGIVLFSTAVRAATLIYCVCAFVYATSVRTVRRRSIQARTFAWLNGLFGVSAAVMIVGTITWIWFPEVFSRWEDRSGSGRSRFQQIVVADLASRPLPDLLFGKGRTYVADLLRQQFGAPIGSHNELLDISSAYGLLGLLVFCWGSAAILSACFGRRFRRTHRNGQCRLAAIAYFLMAMTHGVGNYVTVAYLFGIMLGMMIGESHGSAHAGATVGRTDLRRVQHTRVGATLQAG